MSYNLANDIPGMRYKQIATTTWGAGGTTKTITDGNISSNSQIEIWVTGSTPQAGNWSYVYNEGNVVITSSSSESSTLPLSYYLN